MSNMKTIKSSHRHKKNMINLFLFDDLEENVGKEKSFYVDIVWVHRYLHYFIYKNVWLDLFL